MLSGRELLIQEGNVLQTQIHRLEREVALLREELRIVAARRMSFLTLRLEQPLNVPPTVGLDNGRPIHVGNVGVFQAAPHLH